MCHSCRQYTSPRRLCQWPRRAWLAGLVLVSGLASADGLLLESGPGRVAGLSWTSVETEISPGAWELHMTGLALGAETGLGALNMRCDRSRPDAGTLRCSDGELVWHSPWHDSPQRAEFDLALERGLASVRLAGEGWEARLDGSPGQLDAASARVRFDGFDLAVAPEALLTLGGLSFLSGQVDGVLELTPSRMAADLELSMSFDSPDGSIAGEGVVLALDALAETGEEGWQLRLGGVQTAGELLWNSLYLPSPEEPLVAELAARSDDPARQWRIDRLSLSDPGSLALDASASLEHAPEEGWQLARASVDTFELAFPLAWQRWFDGPAGAAGFGGLVTSGRVTGSARVEGGELLSLVAAVDSVDVTDPQARFAFDTLEGSAEWSGHDGEIALAWAELAVYGLPFQAGTLRLHIDDDAIMLAEPLRLGLLDGALVIDRLESRRTAEADNRLELDARIEPLDLAGLTRLLEFPEFGGTLSGEFPGVVLVDERLSVTGGIDIHAFSGRIEIGDLAIERPFGTLPALSAQVSLTRLDLLELTGAFNFGRMEGRMSGWMRDLRLLDWRPVAMDSRLFTHEDVRTRRISQRAVDNLSNLGGAGGALISGTLLSVFEDFPYRRAGLACRLANNICHIDGVAPHDSGGFYIVEGRLLPRLDIVGHLRLVDWPRLLAQLAAIMEEDRGQDN